MRIKDNILSSVTDDDLNDGTFEFLNNITEIGNCAFTGCEKLTHITLPPEITKIQESAFFKCENLTRVILPKGITTIEHGTFRYCKKLTHITLPQGIRGIGLCAFSGCESLIDITLPLGVKTIMNSAFADCNSLTSITLPEGIMEIDKRAFWNCPNINQIIVSGNEDEVQRTRALLPDNLKDKVISKSYILNWQFNVKEVFAQNELIDDLAKPIFRKAISFFNPCLADDFQIINEAQSATALKL